MDYLENHSEITNRVARELTGIRAENSMKEVFYRLRTAAFLNRCQAEVRLGRRGKRRSIQRMRLTAASFGDGLERPSSRWPAAL
jgi:hypothetical protein